MRVCACVFALGPLLCVRARACVCVYMAAEVQYAFDIALEEEADTKVLFDLRVRCGCWGGGASLIGTPRR